MAKLKQARPKKEEAKAKYGNLYDYEAKHGDGESYKELETRVTAAFKTHREIHGNKNVVIVSHGGVIRMLIKHIKQLSPDDAMARQSVKNAEIVSLDVLDTPCAKCGSDLYEQDNDTFDTWFSSGQWPFITLDYPDGKDFKRHYPTDVMETAGEIIFFWVTRMIMLGLYVTDQVPFRTVYLHGIVLDSKGQKMSKSKGNVTNPLDITSKYGTDALRMALVVGNTPGNSLALADDRVKGYRNFTTKIWNIARFVMLKAGPSGNAANGNEVISSNEDDKKNLAELAEMKKEVGTHIEKFEFHLAAEKAYHYVWHTLADRIIEAAKPRLADTNTDEADKAAASATLYTILIESLTMLHPFMPFITEAIYQKLRPGELLMVKRW